MKKSTSTTSSTNGKQKQEVAMDKPSYLQKFFIDQLKDIYYAEELLLKTLPEMKKAATTEELEDAIENHIKQTERQVKRLEKVFQSIGKNPEGKKCEAMEGLIKEGRSIIQETKEGSMTRDAAMIIGMQKVEHYEIATYGGLVELAMTMGMTRAAELLDRTLQEEEETDRLLTDIAESSINIEAEEEGHYNWKKEETKEAESAAV